MASILEEIFGMTAGGQTPGPQALDLNSPYVQDALKRVLQQQLAARNAGRGDITVSTPERVQAAPQDASGAGRFARPEMAPQQPIAEESIPDRPLAGVPYTAPTTDVVPDDVRRRERPQQTVPTGPVTERRPTAAELFDLPSGGSGGTDIFTRIIGTLLAAPGDTSFLPGGARDKASQAETATLRALVAKGVPLEMAQAATVNPQIMAQIAPMVFGQRTGAEWKQIGTDQFGAAQYGWVNPRDQTITPAQQTIVGPDGQRQAAPQQNVPDMNLTGSAFMDNLRQVSPGDAQLVQGILEGRVPITGNARNARTQRLMAYAAQAEPGFDMTKWTQRNTMARSLGNTMPNSFGGIINALNTAMGHADNMIDAAEKLDNVDFPGAQLAREYVGNPIARNMTGVSDFAAREGRFNTVRKALMDEAAKVFAGSQTALADRRAWEEKITSATGPAQLQAVIQELTSLMKSRLEAQAHAYNQAMGTQRDAYSFMSPNAARSMRRILGEQEQEAPSGQ